MNLAVYLMPHQCFAHSMPGVLPHAHAEVGMLSSSRVLMSTGESCVLNILPCIAPGQGMQRDEQAGRSGWYV